MFCFNLFESILAKSDDKEVKVRKARNDLTGDSLVATATTEYESPALTCNSRMKSCN